MNYLLKPYIGILNMSDGCFFPLEMNKFEFHELINQKPNHYILTMEYYNDYRVDYNENNQIVAFEFFPISSLYIDCPNLDKLKNKNLFEIPFIEINQILVERDSKAQVSDAGVISLKYGIGTYLEDSESEYCESIIIFKKGYYDSLGW